MDNQNQKLTGKPVHNYFQTLTLNTHTGQARRVMTIGQTKPHSATTDNCQSCQSQRQHQSQARACSERYAVDPLSALL